MARSAAERGRLAPTPSRIPLRDWTTIAWRVYAESSRDNLSMIAAGVAFYGFLAMFPALASVVSLYGLLVEPQTVAMQLEEMAGLLPPEARTIVSQQLTQLTGASGGALSFGFAFGVGLTLWAASKGTRALISAMNIAYDEEEKRGFLRLNAMALGLTLAMLLFVIVALALIAAVPAAVALLPLPDGLAWSLRLLRWPILFGAVVAALAVLYRYAPSRDAPQWKWASPGALVATALWLLGSIAFSVYVTSFGDYNKTYGTLAAVAVLLLWFYISSYAVLLGGEINAETERQTRQDTTRGEQQPMGKRGAYSADTLGGTKGK